MAKQDLADIPNSDTEELLEASIYLSKLENLLIEKSKVGEKAYFLNCGLCRGYGQFTEFEETYPCGNCKGRRGSWI